MAVAISPIYDEQSTGMKRMLPSETRLITMLKKFTIDYILLPYYNNQVLTHRTDDPVEVEVISAHLLKNSVQHYHKITLNGTYEVN